VATAVKERLPRARIWGVETEGADCMAQALAANDVVTLRAVTSIARTLGRSGRVTGDARGGQRYVESVTVVSDADAIAAMRLLLERTKMLVEPPARAHCRRPSGCGSVRAGRPRRAVSVRREHQRRGLLPPGVTRGGPGRSRDDAGRTPPG